MNKQGYGNIFTVLIIYSNKANNNSLLSLPIGFVGANTILWDFKFSLWWRFSLCSCNRHWIWG